MSKSNAPRVTQADEPLGRFGHHPNPAIDFLVEVESIERLAEELRKCVTHIGHEADYAALPSRIERALEFRVGCDSRCVEAKGRLRVIARAFGFNLLSEIGYIGAPCPRESLDLATVQERLPVLQPYAVPLVTEREQEK